MATHSSMLAWKIPWAEEPGGLYGVGVAEEPDTTEHTHTLTQTVNTYTYLSLSQSLKWTRGYDAQRTGSTLLQPT